MFNNPNLAAARERVREERMAAAAAHFQMSLSEYKTKTQYEKALLRKKYGTCFKDTAPRKKPVKAVAPSPDEATVRAQTAQTAMLAGRAQLSEEDYQKWYDGQSDYWHDRPRQGTKVQWTDGEEKIIAEWAAAALMKQGIHMVPGKGDRDGISFLLPAIMDGVKHLPRDRRRPVLFRSGVSPSLEKAIRLAIKRGGYKQDHTPAPVTPVAPPAPLGEVLAMPGTKEGAENVLIKHEEIHADNLAEFSTEQLLAAALTRLFSSLRPQQDNTRVIQLEQQVREAQQYQEILMTDLGEMKNELAQLRQPVLPFTQIMPPQEPERVRKVRVALIGCLKVQFDRIVQGVEELHLSAPLEFEWLDANSHPRSFSADYCVMLRWVNHTWQEKINSAVPIRDRRPFLSGGETNAVRQIAAWFGSEPAAAIHG